MSDADPNGSQPETAEQRPQSEIDRAADEASAQGPEARPAESPDQSPAGGSGESPEQGAETSTETSTGKAPAKKSAAKKTAAKTGAKKATAKKAAAKKTPAKKTAKKTAAKKTAAKATAKKTTAATPAPMVLFQAPEKAPEKTAEKSAEKAPEKTAEKAPAAGAEPVDEEARPEDRADQQEQKATPGKKAPAKKAPAKKAQAKKDGRGSKKAAEPEEPAAGETTEQAAGKESGGEDEPGEGGASRRRRRRGGRRRRKSGGEDSGESSGKDESGESGQPDDNGGESGSRRRRTRNRSAKSAEDEIASVSGSTRLEAKKQRRREGREAGRRRAPIVSEAEFLARRESVDRVMVIRQRGDLTQIGVLEDGVLVEHYVARESQTSLIGNVYLGRVQNVLPSMEAAFVDIGKGRNAVLYAGEVNWRGLGHQDGQPRKIESVLSPGQTVLVQVTKDPVGHKGARLTGQVSLPGRFLVYVPDGTTSGISRKLPDTERNRLKTLLKQIVPDSAGVIVRTAAEGASEEELTRDVQRLTARWNDIEKKVEAGKAPELLYGEPDLTLKVVRDLFTEDFSKLVVEGDDAWDLVEGYVAHVAPDLRERLERFHPDDQKGDVFASYRVDEQIAKGLERKVWLPSGGSLIIDRTEAMTVVDVNTGKFTGSGGNLEETVTKNNLEAAEEIVRQLRLRDIGGIIVIDFIDMVLESNRDLVLRRLVECLGRDRTRHQVAEVTSLGLVQMTRKRIGTGLLEAFSTECEHCKGRGVVLHDQPVERDGNGTEDDRGRRGRGGRGRGRSGKDHAPAKVPQPPKPSEHPSPKDIAAMRPHPQPEGGDEDRTGEEAPDERAAGETAADEQAAGEPAIDEKAVEESPEVPVTEPEAPEVEPSPAEETEPVVVEDTQPVVVTSTRRRRTASRPAGPPQGSGEPDEPAPQPSGTPEPADAADTTDAAEASDAAEIPGEAADLLDTEESESLVVHVPVKKKGRKR